MKNSETRRSRYSLAEVEGFEPPVVLPTLVFKTSALGRSATLPSSHRLSGASPFFQALPFLRSGFLIPFVGAHGFLLALCLTPIRFSILYADQCSE